MKANEIIIESITCDDRGIQENGALIIATDCLPSKGDFILLDGMRLECLSKTIRMENGIAYISLTLHTHNE